MIKVFKPINAQTQELLDHLRSEDPKRELIIRETLAQMPPEEAVETIVTMIESCSQKRQVHWYLVALSLMLLCVPLWIGLWVMASSTTEYNRKLRKRCFELLAAFEDARAINPLVQEMLHGAEDAKLSAIIALTRQLPKIKPADAPLIFRSSRQALNEVLLNNVRADFLLAILAAWEQIGDSEAIPFVEKLSLGKSAAGSNRAVRDAAISTLPVLQALVSRTVESDTLLRSSESTGSSSLLLHPITQNVTDTQTLLQAASQDQISDSD